MINTSRRHFLRTTASLSTTTGLGLLVPTSVLAEEKPVVANTAFGKIRGVTKSGVNVFKGLPYGANTGGENRFLPPKDPKPWTGVREAINYGAAAPQSNPSTGRQQDGNEGEDCLAMNIWSRGINDGQKRAVMFWCHGGGFRSLSASSLGYDGTNLCLRGDVVVVSINHRLNSMGFTHFAELGGEEYQHSGNVGMLDIVHALKWVKNNIEEFGGDPDRVMIFGESGGGRKVATLLAMPSAKGLFHSAVIQSGATLRVAEPEQANELAEKFIHAMGLNKSTFNKIKELPLAKIMSAYHATASSALGSGFQPVMDGHILPYHPFYPDASPINPDVPVMLGANRTEMTYFARDDDFNMDEATMRKRVSAFVGEKNLDQVLKTYRAAAPKASPSEIYFLAFSDYRYVMASITIAERRAALQKAPVYLYYLTWESPSRDGKLLSPHSLDIPFAFDNTRINPLTRDSDDAIALADKVSEAWIAFAKTGNPNAGKLPQWKPFNSETKAAMVINDESQLVSDPLKQRRELMLALMDL